MNTEENPRWLEYPVIPDLLPLPPIRGGSNSDGGGQIPTEEQITAILLHRQQMSGLGRRRPRRVP